ncbi:MAG: porin family protein [Bacteroidota bacterium]
MILFLMPLLATAQIKVGLKAGGNLANFIYHPEYDGDKKGAGTFLLRFKAGIMLEVPLNDNDNWFIYTGTYYNGKGNRVRAKHTSPPFDTIITYLNYIELPVIVGYKFSSGNNGRVIAGAGPYASYGFKGKVVYNNSPERTERNLHRSAGDYKRIDFGFLVSGMYEYKEKFGIRFDYSGSIPDISRHGWKETNNVFSFSFFFYFIEKKNKDE